MSEKFLIVRFSDQSIYEIPLRFIAEHRARYYAWRDIKKGNAAKRPVTDCSKIFNAEVEFALEDDYEAIDWATNNMGWPDVEDHAVQISGVKPSDKAEEWVNADMGIV